MTTFCFFAALLLVSTTFLLSVLQPHFQERLNYRVMIRISLISFFSSGILLHYPLYAKVFYEENCVTMKAFLASVHHTLRMFVLDGELDPIHEFADSLGGNLSTGYFILSTIVYLVSPLLTFGAVLSFFKDLSALRNFYSKIFSNAYIFSELNERSLSLASDIRKNHPGCLVVFTDVYEDNEEITNEQIHRAKMLGAVCFKRDITEVSFGTQRRRRSVHWFLIGKNENENIHQAVYLSQTYGKNSKMELYLFSSGTESELLFQSVPDEGMRIRRINENRLLVNQLLYEQGTVLFKQKRIYAVIVGLGQYGTELLKAFSWFGQMDGYHLTIHVFDNRADAESLFRAQCPELMDSKHNGTFVPGEAHYTIRIHSAIDTKTEEYREIINRLPDITYVFVALGNDRLNIQEAVRMRELCEARGVHPDINTVVYDSFVAQALKNAVNYRGTPYDIHYMGSLSETYTEENIMDSKIVREALRRHLLWGKESDFWRCEFNYRSSIASALHQRVRIQCKISGADKPEKERSLAEHERLQILEHQRWNAYMRSEGYCFSGSTAPESRNDMAKLHNCLVPYEMLSKKEKKKDNI